MGNIMGLLQDSFNSPLMFPIMFGAAALGIPHYFFHNVAPPWGPGAPLAPPLGLQGDQQILKILVRGTRAKHQRFLQKMKIFWTYCFDLYTGMSDPGGQGKT